MGLPYGENFIILTSTIFLRSARVADGQIEIRTDGRTDGRAIAYSVLKIDRLCISCHLQKVCNEEARCHAVNESVLVWRERRGAGPLYDQL